jgi:hypothetical protein
MAGGYYLCPVCHHPFPSIGAKREHVNKVHQEAAELYLRLDPVGTVCYVYKACERKTKPIYSPFLPPIACSGR